MKRLPFRLKEFTRCSWVSDPARELWEPRLQRISTCLNELQRLSVQAGMRRCALLSTNSDELESLKQLAQQSGLVTRPLRKMAAPSTYSASLIEPQPDAPFNFWVAVGHEASLQQFVRAHERNDDETVGHLLGYPECCRRFFQRVWVRDGNIDTSWPMVEHVHLIEGTNGTFVEIAKPSLCNILLRWMGLRAIFHLPCSFDCRSSIECARQMLQLGIDNGFESEIEWLGEALYWPVEWSALHGIAEIKTPLFKVSTCTDATAVKYVIRYVGSTYPEEGAAGLSFPYRVPTVRRISNSRQFKEGLSHPVSEQKPAIEGNEWLFRDNGFSSKHAMELSHAPLVDFAKTHLQDIKGRTIDLGCGNGVLVKKICAAVESCVPAGVDLSADKIRRAQDAMPEHAKHFIVGNLIDCLEHSSTHHFAAGLLMLGRLAEHQRDEARRFIINLQERVGRLIIYAYDDFLSSTGESLCDLASHYSLNLEHYQCHPLISLGYVDLPALCVERMYEIIPGSSPARRNDMELQPNDDIYLADEIHWELMAEPQSDQYDTKVTLEFAKQKGYRPSDIANNLPTFCDGHVVIRYDDKILEPYCTAANHDHPNIERGGNLLRFWPEVFSQLQALVDTVSVFYDPEHTDDLVVGSICGPGEGGFGKIAATVTHHAGFAEALVHEMAHHKLRALGVHFDRSERIVANNPSQLFLSPIRHDIKRPMSAVLHAQYSYTYVTALDNAIVCARTEPDRDAVIAQAGIAVNVPKLQFGLKEIEENIKTGADGEAFLTGLYSWSERVFAESLSLLDELNISPQTFRHPLI